MEQGEEFFVFVRGADATVDGIARAQVEAFDLRRRNVDIVGAGEIVIVGRPQKTEPLGERFEHALAPNLAALSRLRLEYAVDEFLPAEVGGVFDVERGGFFEQLRNVHAFNIFDEHGISKKRERNLPLKDRN